MATPTTVGSELRCAACGGANSAGRKFCGECGAALRLVCPSCQTPNEPGVKFCGECGGSLGGEPAAATAPSVSRVAGALPASFGAGRYSVDRFLGEGGKKRVYLARDTRLNRDVAIALIKSDGLDASGLARVRREAQAMGELGDHPHVVTIFDVAEEEGHVYIVSQYMAGGDLEARLQSAEDHRLSLDETLGVAEQICQALEHAHARGLIHRDLKPGNVWFGEDGSAQLGDFGLAVSLDRSRLTQEGMIVGTVAYMPPEQALGRALDTRSDLYALGALLYEMATGRPPFLGDDAVGIISQHINTQAVAPSWHNPAAAPLDALVQRLLAKAPEDRPAAASDVRAQLRAIRDRAARASAETTSPVVTTGLQGVEWGVFIGRHEEMNQLRAALEDTLSARGQLVMLVGEPGIGKTRMAEEFGVYAGLRGARVLTGRCYEGEFALPYRPFVACFRDYARAHEDAELREQLGSGAPEIAKLVSEVRERFPDLPEAAPLESDAERLRLFESVASFLRGAAAVQPLVLVLDDIHWADKPTLLLLQYLARSMASERVMLVGAYRDVELERTHPLAEMVAGMRREANYRRVLLRGVSQDDVVTLLKTLDPSADATGRREAFAAAIYQETEGNPFFIREVLAHLVEEGKLYREDGRWTSNVTSVSDLGIPEGVREVVGRRLSRLSEGCNRLLTLASTMTDGFSWEALRAITSEDDAALLELLEEALTARVVVERRDKAGVYDFTHALIRQTLYDELSTPRRVLLHRQIGEALERLYAANLEPHFAELARHFYQAAPGGDVDKAIGYARRAGDRAAGLMAHEDAASHYEIALQALDLKQPEEPRRRFDLLMALGDAYTRADVPERAASVTEQAVELADSIGDAALRADAAIAYSRAISRGPQTGTGRATPAVERALVAIGEDDPSRRARLLVELAISLMNADTVEGRISRREERRAAAEEAREIAERIDDAQALAGALGSLHVLHAGPELVEERLALATRWVEAAERAENANQALLAHMGRMSDLAELGEMGDVDAELHDIFELTHRIREPAWTAWRHIYVGMRAAMRGHYEEAERSALLVFPLTQRMGNPVAMQAAAAQLFRIRRAQGRVDEIEPLIQRMVEENPENRAWQAALADLFLVTGRRAEAHELFEQVASDDFEHAFDDANAMVLLYLSAILVRGLGDARRAALLYEILRPYAARQITLALTISCYGSAARPLGMLAAAMGDWSRAESHFEAALGFDEKLDAPPWLALTQLEYALMLRDRGEPGDAARAATLVGRALPVFERIGMKTDLERAVALKLELQGIDADATGRSIHVVNESVQQHRPDLASHAAPDGTVTLMFSDMEGFTAMTERLGDLQARDVIHDHNRVVREQVASHGGYEVELQGDGFLLAFGSARRALQCAIAIHRAFARRNARSQTEPIRVRIGLHTGEVLRDADKFFGKTVIMAARIAAHAAAGEILVSGLLKELTESAGDLRFDGGRQVELKGISGSQRVFAVAWE
jgi:predicted ATPase/class 3 adenylate cyclase